MQPKSFLILVVLAFMGLAWGACTPTTDGQPVKGKSQVPAVSDSESGTLTVGELRKHVASLMVQRYGVDYRDQKFFSQIPPSKAEALLDEAFEGFRDKGPAYSFAKSALKEEGLVYPVYGEFTYQDPLSVHSQVSEEPRQARVLLIPTSGLKSVPPKELALGSRKVLTIDLQLIRDDLNRLRAARRADRSLSNPDEDDCRTCTDCIGSSMPPCKCLCIETRCLCDMGRFSCTSQCERKFDSFGGSFEDYLESRKGWYADPKPIVGGGYLPPGLRF